MIKDPSLNLLNNVVVMRPVLIYMLVFYHSFAIYSGAWDPIDGYPDIQAYWWLDKLSYVFMLEMFVFISGYVFGFQVRTKGESKLKIKSLLYGKLKRLMVPCVIFSSLYIILFDNINQPITETIYSIVNGVGHMWFLPMLFWCFIFICLIEKIEIKPVYKFILLFVLSFCSFVDIPLRINVSMYYMIFFYLGYIIQRKKINIDMIYKTYNIVFLIVSFAFLFPLLTLFREYASEIMGGGQNSIEEKIVIYLLCYIAKLLNVFLGIVMMFSIIGRFVNSSNKKIPQWVIDFGGLCMGIYLFQQFILKGCYIYSELPYIVGPYLLPWTGFIIALVCSFLLSYVINKIYIGRYIIG